MSKKEQVYKMLKPGLSIFDKKHKDEILVDPLFLQAKKGNVEAAEQLIEKFWSDEKTQELKLLLEKDKKTVFFSVPGTSRLNQIPVVFARFLAKKTSENNSLYLIGDEHIASLHTSMMKSVKNGDRLMSPRLYEAYDPHFFERIQNVIPNAQIVLVEDIITTGSSVNTFRRFLEHNGLQVDCIAAVKGDTQISPTMAGLQKLEKMAKKVALNDIKFDIQALGSELTHSEVVSLSFQYLGERYRRADNPTKRLMRHQLASLYEVKVNHRYEAAKKMEILSQLINRREQKNVIISKNKEENQGGKVVDFLRAVQNNEEKAQQELSTYTGRKGVAGGSESNACYVKNAQEKGIRDNKDAKRSSEGRFEHQQFKSETHLHSSGEGVSSRENEGKGTLTFSSLIKQKNQER